MPRSTRSVPTAAPAALARVRALAYMLDDSIPVPGTGRRIGIDPLLGLVPGVGDAAGALLSVYLIVEAARLGTPPAVLTRMAGNVVLEALVGAVPLLGDLFDAGWKANARNLRLLEAHLREPARAARASRAWVLGLVLVILAVFAGAAVLAVWIAIAALRAIGVA